MNALICVDLQNDFFTGGALEVEGSLDIIPIVNDLIDRFNKDFNSIVVGTLDSHPSNHKSFASNSLKDIGEVGLLNGIEQVFWPDHCIKDTFGWKVHKEIKPIETTILKGEDREYDSYSGFFDISKTPTKLHSLLKENKVDTLYILGLATDYCVKYTVLDALSLGYKVFLVEDGCRGVNLSKDDSLEAIKEMEGKGATIITTKEVTL